MSDPHSGLASPFSTQTEEIFYMVKVDHKSLEEVEGGGTQPLVRSSEVFFPLPIRRRGVAERGDPRASLTAWRERSSVLACRASSLRSFQL